ncbi:hypothetical protein [Massilia aerilata]|uniref:Uncharacterized protein n=1 Tax=Massilia aerilata TaxID=453817 RepID=A0ABW0RT43_9BURK
MSLPCAMQSDDRASALREAERLACLRMMMDQGVQDADYPRVGDGRDERARVFERLLGL